MPGWKINCLKSEDGTNPSTLSSPTTDDINKIEIIQTSTDYQSSGNLIFLCSVTF